MRKVAIAIVGLALFGVYGVGGCESDVSGPSGTPTGVGGQATTTIYTTSTTGSGGGGGAGGGCPGCTPCEAACYKIQYECSDQFPVQVTCAMVPGGLLDCENNTETADCNGLCVLAAECGDLIGLALGQPAEDLSDCLTQCLDPCEGCVLMSCQTAFAACSEDPDCQAFSTCISEQECTDSACVATCLADNNDSEAAQALVDCTCENCGEECSTCAAGGQGGAGGGGQGGAGGSQGGAGGQGG